MENEHIYSVRNIKKNIVCEINIDVGVCSYVLGCTGNFCKHQILLSEKLPNFVRK